MPPPAYTFWFLAVLDTPTAHLTDHLFDVVM